MILNLVMTFKTYFEEIFNPPNTDYQNVSELFTQVTIPVLGDPIGDSRNSSSKLGLTARRANIEKYCHGTEDVYL